MRQKCPMLEGEKVLPFRFVLSLYIMFSFGLLTCLWGGGGQVWPALHEGWADKEADGTCTILLGFWEKPRLVLNETYWDTRATICCAYIPKKNRTDYPERGGWGGKDGDGVKLWNTVYFKRATTFTRLIKSRLPKHASPPQTQTSENWALTTVFFKSPTTGGNMSPCETSPTGTTPPPTFTPTLPPHLKDEVDMPPLCKIYHVRWFN